MEREKNFNISISKSSILRFEERKTPKRNNFGKKSVIEEEKSKKIYWLYRK